MYPQHLSHEDEDPAARVRRLSPHFHTSEKGCDVRKGWIPWDLKGVPYSKRSKAKKRHGHYCLTHSVETCHDGWAWLFHPPFRDPMRVVALVVIESPRAQQ